MNASFLLVFMLREKTTELAWIRVSGPHRSGALWAETFPQLSDQDTSGTLYHIIMGGRLAGSRESSVPGEFCGLEDRTPVLLIRE